MPKKKLRKSKSRQVSAKTASEKARIESLLGEDFETLAEARKALRDQAVPASEKARIESLLGEDFETLTEARKALRDQAVPVRPAPPKKKQITGREIIERAIRALEVRGPGVRPHITQQSLSGRGDDMLIKITIKTPSYERIAVAKNIAAPEGKIRKTERWSWSTIKIKGHSRRRRKS